jgi:hypothetical protein
MFAKRTAAISKKINQFYNSIWEKRDSLLKHESNLRAKLIKISSRILIFGSLILLVFALKEQIIGDVPIYSQIPDGAVCNDGWISSSQGPGTCSYHSGVNYYLFDKIQTGTDYANPGPFFLSILILLIVISVLSLINISYRWASIKSIADIIYLFLFLIHRILLIIFYLPWILIVMIYTLYLRPIFKFIVR